MFVRVSETIFQPFLKYPRLHYQQIANSSSSGGGGVRQDVTGCIIGATYRVSGWMRGNSMANSTCTVKVSPTASTNWATAIDLTPPQSYTGNTWVPFSGTVKATGTSMTLWLDGRTGGTGQFKAECFDSVTVTCESVPKPLGFASVALLPEQEMQLILSLLTDSERTTAPDDSARISTIVPLPSALATCLLSGAQATAPATETAVSLARSVSYLRTGSHRSACHKHRVPAPEYVARVFPSGEKLIEFIGPHHTPA